ncbi:MAG: MFS transporter [Anaerolineales bacterium]|nr:MFS transporter [Anaerolineales bacterium]
MTDVVATTIERAIRFVRRQKRNYRVAITRSAVSSFLLNLTAPYDSIYTVALGADSVELGTISSIGNGIGALISMPVGWLVDRRGLKPFYLLGMGLLAGGSLVYALAPTWEVIIAATILLTISMQLISTGCSVICTDSVRNEGRATAQNLCVTLASLLSMIAPLVAARLVTIFGGMTVEGIRPLYYIRFVGYGLILLFVAAQLREPRRVRTAEAGANPGFIGDFRQIFEGGGPLGRWLVIASLTGFSVAITSPFLPLFAHQMKGADQYLLAAMTTASVLMRLLFGIPLGRLADRVGRKKVIYLLTPLWYASHLLLVFSLNSATLILAGALWTFYFISSGVTHAMTLELVPVEHMGKWIGLLSLFGGLVTIPAPVIGGLIWREMGPMYVFLIPLAVDLLVRIPLLTTIPETLKAAPFSGRQD